MTDDCPKHCRDDRQMIHKTLEEMKMDRRRRWSAFLGTMVIVLGGAFMLLYNGISHNSEKIVEAQKELADEMKSFARDLDDLKIIVTRIDERTRTTNSELEKHRKMNGG